MSFLKRLLAWFQPDTSRPLTQAWLAALWMGLLANWPLWKQLQALPGIGTGFILAFAGMITAATGAVLSLLAWPRLIKAVLVVLLLSAGALAYFIGSYGIVFDPTMVVNLLQTDARETRDLLSWRLLASLALLGALPAWWLLRRPRAPAQPFVKRLGGNLAAFGDTGDDVRLASVADRQIGEQLAHCPGRAIGINLGIPTVSDLIEDMIEMLTR